MELRPKGIAEVQLREANIGEDYWAADFRNYQGPAIARDRSIMYLTKLEEMNEEGLGIMFAGPPGPGKTTAMMIIAKYLARARWNVFTTSLGEIVENIQKSWKSDDESNSEFLERCRTADFLFIDDLGKEHRGASGFVQTVFDNLIRHRVQHRTPTFLTTNLTKSEIETLYGDSVTSLLEGKIIPVVVNGDDHRRTVQKQNARKKL